MNLDDFLIALVEHIQDDPELRQAVLDYIRARTKAEMALANWRERR